MEKAPSIYWSLGVYLLEPAPIYSRGGVGVGGPLLSLYSWGGWSNVRENSVTAGEKVERRSTIVIVL